MTLKPTAWLLAALAVGSTPSIALARDHLELVCTGVVVNPKDGGARFALFFHLFDSRARDGASRDQRLSTIYQGQLFQGYHLKKDDERDIPVALKRGGRIWFKGSYTLDNQQGAGAFTLRVAGKVNGDPSAKRPSYRDEDEVLSCVDLSI